MTKSNKHLYSVLWLTSLIISLSLVLFFISKPEKILINKTNKTNTKRFTIQQNLQDSSKSEINNFYNRLFFKKATTLDEIKKNNILILGINNKYYNVDSLWKTDLKDRKKRNEQISALIKDDLITTDLEKAIVWDKKTKLEKEFYKDNTIVDEINNNFIRNLEIKGKIYSIRNLGTTFRAIDHKRRSDQLKALAKDDITIPQIEKAIFVKKKKQNSTFQTLKKNNIWFKLAKNEENKEEDEEEGLLFLFPKTKMEIQIEHETIKYPDMWRNKKTYQEMADWIIPFLKSRDARDEMGDRHYAVYWMIYFVNILIDQKIPNNELENIIIFNERSEKIMHTLMSPEGLKLIAKINDLKLIKLKIENQDYSFQHLKNINFNFSQTSFIAFKRNNGWEPTKELFALGEKNVKINQINEAVLAFETAKKFIVSLSLKVIKKIKSFAGNNIFLNEKYYKIQTLKTFDFGKEIFFFTDENENVYQEIKTLIDNKINAQKIEEFFQNYQNQSTIISANKIMNEFWINQFLQKKELNWDLANIFDISQIKIKNKIYNIFALKTFDFKKNNVFFEIINPETNLQIWTLIKNKIQFIQIQKAIQESVKEKIHLLLNESKNNDQKSLVLKKMINLKLKKIIINQKIYNIFALKTFDFKKSNFINEANVYVKKQIFAFFKDKINYQEIKKALLKIEKSRFNLLLENFKKKNSFLNTLKKFKKNTIKIDEKIFLFKSLLKVKNWNEKNISFENLSSKNKEELRKLSSIVNKTEKTQKLDQFTKQWEKNKETKNWTFIGLSIFLFIILFIFSTIIIYKKTEITKIKY